jgi:hypothetical protein
MTVEAGLGLLLLGSILTIGVFCLIVKFEMANKKDEEEE